ncbi:MAG: helix-turn-helix domain-containing protein [Longimicrobiales bacterium]
MAAGRPTRSARKLEALQEHGALHPRPQDVTDPLFHESPFFDARDIVQVKYEMLRRVRVDERQVSETAVAFGFSRPSFYAARSAFQQEGLPGLLPQKRGPRRAHKLTDEVIAVLAAARTEDGAVPGAKALAKTLKDQFGITAHPRSIERSLQRYRQQREKKRR